jgi:long-chain acyl-CoA synthetase
VIGVPDARWGERVHAIVRIDATASADADTLRAHCRELLADFKCPRSFEFVLEPLPRNAANKILKRQIRDPYWRNQERKV